MPAIRAKRHAARGSIKVEPAVNNKLSFMLLALFIVIVLLLLVGPFFRGLYFPRELLVVHMISFTLFSIWLFTRWLRSASKLLETPLDFSNLALVFFYFISIFVAVNRREAVGEFLKVANYFVIYLMVFDLCRYFYTPSKLFWRSKQKNASSVKPLPFGLHIFLHAAILSGVALALGGLASAGGLDLLEGAYVWGRLYSPLQYPNTSAAYFLAALFLTIGYMFIHKKLIMKMLYSIPAVILFIAIILTFSRAVWLMAPILALIFLTIAGRGKRLHLGLYLAGIVLAGLPLSFPVHYSFQQNQPLLAWLYITTAIAIVLLLTYVAELFLIKLTPKARVTALLISSFTILGIVLFRVFFVLGSPLHLEVASTEPPGERYFEQIIFDARGNEEYLLSFDVDFLSSSPGDEQDYVWLLKVSAEVPEKYGHEYRSITLERHKEKAPLGERQYYEFDFTTPEALRQLTIRFSLNYPGTSATFKNVVLRCPGEEKKLNFSFQRFLPRPVYERFAGFRTALTEEPRVLHYRDAWKIIQDYSLFGAGGGAWESLYLGYTEKVFYTTEPHSHFLKIWLEAGLFAFLAFIGIWLSVLYSYRRIRSAQQEMPEEQVVATALYVAIFTLGLHAAVDFSFSLGSVSLLFFTLLGAGRSLIYEEEKLSKHVKKRPRNLKLQFTLVLGLLISILLLLYSFSLWLGFRAGTAAAVALEKREYREAEMLLHRAMRWDLLQAANYSTLAGLYQYRAESSPDRNEATWLMNEALKYAYQAWRREPYNITYNRQHGLLLLNFGEVEEGLNYLERTIDLDPYDPAHYVQTAASTLAATEYYLKAGQKQKAIVLLKRLIEMEARMERYHESAKRLNFYLGKAYFLLDDRPNAVNYWSDVDEDDQNYSASRQWLHKLKEHPDS